MMDNNKNHYSLNTCSVPGPGPSNSNNQFNMSKYGKYFLKDQEIETWRLSEWLKVETEPRCELRSTSSQFLGAVLGSTSVCNRLFYESRWLSKVGQHIFGHIYDHYVSPVIARSLSGCQEVPKVLLLLSWVVLSLSSATKYLRSLSE